jgi:hypothetical protein
VDREEFNLKAEFDLKTVIEFLESGGYHVREAREVNKVINPLFPAEIGAIRLEITPKEKD